MPHGRVKFLNLTMGYGFILPDGGGQDVYISAREVEAAKLRGIRKGDRVSFEMGQHSDTKRPIATQIRFLDEERQAAPEAL